MENKPKPTPKKLKGASASTYFILVLFSTIFGFYEYNRMENVKQINSHVRMKRTSMECYIQLTRKYEPESRFTSICDMYPFGRQCPCYSAFEHRLAYDRFGNKKGSCK